MNCPVHNGAPFCSTLSPTCNCTHAPNYSKHPLYNNNEGYTEPSLDVINRQELQCLKKETAKKIENLKAENECLKLVISEVARKLEHYVIYGVYKSDKE